jgi:hypothetical protein
MSHSAKSALTETRRVVKIALAAVAGFSIIVNLLVLALPLYSLQIFDRVLSSRSVETLLALTVVTIGLLALQAALDHVRGAVLRKVALRVETSLTGPVLRASLDEGSRGSPHADGGPARSARGAHGGASPGLSALFDLPLTPFFVLVVFLIHPLLGFFVIGAIAILAVLTGTHVARRPPSAGRGCARRAEGGGGGAGLRAPRRGDPGSRHDRRCVERRWRKQNTQLLARRGPRRTRRRGALRDEIRAHGRSGRHHRARRVARPRRRDHAGRDDRELAADGARARTGRAGGRRLEELDVGAGRGKRARDRRSRAEEPERGDPAAPKRRTRSHERSIVPPGAEMPSCAAFRCGWRPARRSRSSGRAARASRRSCG